MERRKLMSLQYCPTRKSCRCWVLLISLLVSSSILFICVESLSSSSAGPKGSVSRRPRRRTERPNHPNNNKNNGIPNQQRPSKAAQRQQQQPIVKFDAKKLTQNQKSNEESALPLDVSLLKISIPTEISMDTPKTTSSSSSSSSSTDDGCCIIGKEIQTNHIRFMSLDELFDRNDMSELFVSNEQFRQDLRSSIRQDVFDSTPAYQNLSPKAAKFMLHPDSSLQGSWRCGDDGLRMNGLTKVLREYLGEDAPNGDEFMNAIGSLCGEEPSTHWMDIIGVQDRSINHSWHQDTGNNKSCQTVMLGFPAENNYDGTGVFSHGIPLSHQLYAPPHHPTNQPILFENTNISEKYIIRPRFAKYRELLVYSDTDIIHSAPDVTYRSSIMRFM